jgi:hypothetical protein
MTPTYIYIYIYIYIYVETESVQFVVMKVLIVMLFAVNSVLLQQECAFLKMFVELF